MRNLEQIRAAHAIAFWANGGNQNQGAEGGDAVSKMPSMLLGNGLLASMAFASDKGGTYAMVMMEVARHLSSEGIRIIQPPPPAINFGSLEQAIAVLAQNPSLVLQRATTEALAYLAYLKRFAP